MARKDWLKRAERIIERDGQELYDYCANIGQIAGNVKDVRGFAEGFARWLEEEG